jgi:putative hemolysin
MALSLVALLILFLLSGFFSASETALFSLRREDHDWLRRRGSRPARSVLELLSRPRTLLVSVLFGNLLVNFLLFAVSAGLASDLSEHGLLGIALGFLLTTVSVLVLGEVTPKAIAVTAPRRVALVTGPVLLAFRNATGLITLPLARTVAWVLDLVEQRLGPPLGALTDQELKRFVELHGQEGALERSASEFLAEALELSSRRVHEVMTPRVDLVTTSLEGGRAELFALAREHRLGKLLVHRGDPDDIHGYIRTKDLLLHEGDDLSSLLRPLWFVPRTKSLESLLREMVERNELIALVVGEYGGTAGLVTLEDVVEEITGDIAREDAAALLRPGADGTWRMAGRFPLREAGELLGLSFPPGPTTLSGFVAHSLGRIPEVGDVVWHKRVQFKVGSLDRRRAREVLVALPQHAPPRRPDQVSEAMTRSGAQRARKRLEQWVDDSQPTQDEGAKTP